MNRKRTFILIMNLMMVDIAVAQQFAVPLEGFSRSKTAYLYMEDGTKLEGLLGGFKRSKGLIETVKMKDPNGGKVAVDPDKISYMYLPPSSIAKLGAMTEKMNDVNKWEKTSTMDTSLLDGGYVYFEKSSTKVKKKTEDLMLQLMNASFSSKIKVYHDPFANETASIGVGGFTVAGGLDKSYYVKKEGDETAFRLMKKDYKEQFGQLFGDNPEFISKYQDDINWSNLEEHVFEYTQMAK